MHYKQKAMMLPLSIFFFLGNELKDGATIDSLYSSDPRWKKIMTLMMKFLTDDDINKLAKDGFNTTIGPNVLEIVKLLISYSSHYMVAMAKTVKFKRFSMSLKFLILVVTH